MRRTPSVAAVGMVMVCAGSAVALPPSFTRIGDLPGGVFDSQAQGISADGSTVVGFSASASGTEAFVYRNGVLATLSDLAGGTVSSAAYAVNADGTVVVGDGNNASGNVPVRWVRSGATFGGAQSLGIAPGSFGSSGTGVDATGDYVCGFRSIPSPGFFEAFRLRVSTNTRNDLGDLALPVYFSLANGISADATTVVGSGSSTDDDGGLAFRWRSGTGMVELPELSDGLRLSEALGCSADGNVIVGYSYNAAGQQAVRWVNDTIELIGDLPGGAVNANALAVNADGSVVVGRSNAGNGQEAFIWTQADGMQKLATVLTAKGLNLTGWILREARGISADGLTITGYGVNPQGQNEAYVAYLGSAAPCPADLTGDGFVDDTDFVIFAQAYDQFTVPPADAAADLNSDGFVDDADFVIFAQAYDQFACPR